MRARSSTRARSLARTCRLQRERHQRRLQQHRHRIRIQRQHHWGQLQRHCQKGGLQRHYQRPWIRRHRQRPRAAQRLSEIGSRCERDLSRRLATARHKKQKKHHQHSHHQHSQHQRYISINGVALETTQETLLARFTCAVRVPLRLQGPSCKGRLAWGVQRRHMAF